MTIDTLLSQLVKEAGSDLHLKVNAPPIMRKYGKLFILNPELPSISNTTIQELISPIINDSQRESLNQDGSVDIGYGIKGLGRFRFNIFFQRGSLRLVARHIPHTIPTIEELNLPKQYLDIIDKTERGLILVSGKTGSGKSTTLAGLINYINNTQSKHILTIEDPIEFLIKDRKSLITQRELDVDCSDPITALKSALRQDPDIILFSELRSKTSIVSALTAAETGHLVFSTVHTHDTAETINRLISSFSPDEANFLRQVLAANLKAVFAQRLLMNKKNNGHVPAVEILINNARIRTAIEKQESTQKIRNIIHSSHSHYGMQTFDQSIVDLVKKGLVSIEEAQIHASSSNDLALALRGISNDNNYSQKQQNLAMTQNNHMTKTTSIHHLSLKETAINSLKTKSDKKKIS